MYVKLSVLNFLNMRTLFTVIAHDPSAAYFLGLIKTEIKAYLKHTSCGRPLVKLFKHTPPPPPPPPHPVI